MKPSYCSSATISVISQIYGKDRTNRIIRDCVKSGPGSSYINYVKPRKSIDPIYLHACNLNDSGNSGRVAICIDIYGYRWTNNVLSLKTELPGSVQNSSIGKQLGDIIDGLGCEDFIIKGMRNKKGETLIFLEDEEIPIKTLKLTLMEWLMTPVRLTNPWWA